MAMDPIPLCVPNLGEDEARMLSECLASTFVSSVGPFVDRFEREFAAAVGSPHAVACASGTAALHLALRVLGVGSGDTVLVSDCTFIASANPVVYQGATPVFIDSELASWNLDPRLVAQALDDLVREGRKPKAVVAVHILGQPADLGPIVDACARHGVALVEDATEALGAAYTNAYPHESCRGRQCGTVGAIGCFSFNGNKLITTGGGGMLATADETLAKRLKHLSTQAKLPGLAFVHDEVGYNYRLTNLAAALGIAQLARLPDFLRRKRHIAARYRAWCAGHGCSYQPVLPGTVPNEWLCSFLTPHRNRLLTALNAAQIGARPLWQPLSEQPCLKGARRWGGAIAARLAVEGMSVPCSTGLTDADQDRVLEALDRAMDRRP